MKPFITASFIAATVLGVTTTVNAGPDNFNKITLGSYEEFVAKCDNKNANNGNLQAQVQKEAEDITVTCTDTTYAWVPVNNGQEQIGDFNVPKELTREYSLSVNSTKYQVINQGGREESACPTFKQIRQTASTPREHLTCADVKQFPTAAEFCKATMNDYRGKNGNQIASEETGRIATLCPVQQREIRSTETLDSVRTRRTPTGQR